MQYSINGDYPITSLPHRIRLSNGLTKTDNTTFTDDDLVSAGITTVADTPTYNTNTHKVVWNRETTEWDVVELSEDELENLNMSKWDVIRTQRDSLLNDCDQRVLRYQSEERAGITTHADSISDLDTYMQALRDIPQTNSDPDSISWPTAPGDPPTEPGE
jgi:hypothetical protein|tara:strand:+ start:195 stop:674 length:480 start_codon:yes stop_codon:yes gene_type:complete